MAAMKKLGLLTCLLTVIAMATPSFAQVGGAPGGGAGGGGAGGGPGGGAGGGAGGGGRGRRGAGFDPAAMLAALQTTLGATDDEWAVLSPKIQAVIDAQQADPPVQFGRGGRGGGGRRGGGGAGGAAPTPSPVAAAIADLNTTLMDPAVTPDAIKGKLDALRQARQKANDDLTAAQTALKSNLTQRQEALLVVNGLLN